MNFALVIIGSIVALLLVGAEIPRAATTFVRAWIPLIQAFRDAWDALLGRRSGQCRLACWRVDPGCGVPAAGACGSVHDRWS
jgi:hypothetical protein